MLGGRLEWRLDVGLVMGGGIECGLVLETGLDDDEDEDEDVLDPTLDPTSRS